MKTYKKVYLWKIFHIELLTRKDEDQRNAEITAFLSLSI